MKNILNHKYFRNAFWLVVGVLAGWLLFHSSDTIVKHNHTTEAVQPEIWTCAMHPGVRLPEPGKCPICAMDLIPLVQGGTSHSDAGVIHLSPSAAQLANVETSVVSVGTAGKTLRLYGKIEADERLLKNQIAQFPGRIEQLYVNFTGESIRKGQQLAEVYSPQLIVAQQELIEAAGNKTVQPEIYAAARDRLIARHLTDSQIFQLEHSGKVTGRFVVLADVEGIVTTKRVNTGDYVGQGSVMFEVADLSKVWALFDAYESDLAFIQKGDQLNFSIQALPDATFSGTVMFIDPVVDAQTRVSKVRVEINNRSGKLKPGMFANGTITANTEAYRNKLTVPRSAVLWTGKRSVVYVKQPSKEGFEFKMRMVNLGPVLGDRYVITDGLTEGEEIVTQGAFSVDAAAQLEGKPSMMNGTQAVQPETKTEMNQSKTKHEMLKVAGNCDMCKERIETAAKAVKGVMSAEWKAETQMLHVEIMPGTTSSDAVTKAVALAGHDAGKYKAPDSIYNALPECCLYRK